LLHDVIGLVDAGEGQVEGHVGHDDQIAGVGDAWAVTA
jgi:hypothetical protein